MFKYSYPQTGEPGILSRFYTFANIIGAREYFSIILICISWVVVATQQVKLPLGISTSILEYLVCVPASLSPVQLPSNASWEAAIESRNAWVPVRRVGDSDGVPGSWH